MTGTLTVRADSSPTIGAGHVMRMIALGQAWYELGGQVHFIGCFKSLEDRIKAEGFSITRLTNSWPAQSDLTALLEATSPSDWVALDGYHFDLEYQQRIREADRKTLVMDDVCNREGYDADILLNQNLDAAKYAYPINPEAIQLIGADYTLIRKEFLHQAVPEDLPPQAKNVLITFGGADPTNMTPRILDILDGTVDGNIHITVITGSANQNRAEIQEKVAQLACTCEILTDVDDMPSLIRKTDAAITAAGSTCWELCYYGTPMLAIQVADNQAGVIAGLMEHGAALCIDGRATHTEIAKSINTVVYDKDTRAALNTKARTLIDGKGAIRLARLMANWNLSLRRAEHDDSETILKWRNEPTTRASSFHSEVIPFDEHNAWFNCKLADDTCLFYMAIDEQGRPVGQIRFDKQPDNEAIISISVAPEMKNRGIGTTVTQLACRQLAESWPGCRAVALVKTDNPASSAMFIKAGFSLDHGQELDHLRYVWPPLAKDN